MTATETQTEVVMAHEVENRLDDLFSGPLDAIVAIDQLHLELPKLHRLGRWSRLAWIRAGSLKRYRGHIDWVGVDFTYVQVDDRLHMLDCWEAGYHRPGHKPHDVLGEASLDPVEWTGREMPE